jgi:hypothetical protein
MDSSSCEETHLLICRSAGILGMIGLLGETKLVRIAAFIDPLVREELDR